MLNNSNLLVLVVGEMLLIKKIKYLHLNKQKPIQKIHTPKLNNLNHYKFKITYN